jgi:membrane dipeptidase
VDLSHSGEKTCLDAIAASRSPVTISHSGCRALGDTPRNKTDAELRALADRGGFFGVYFMPLLTPGRQAMAADVIAHLEHAINICGEDHVGIGTDGSATPVNLDTLREAQHQYVEMRRKQGIAATGESGDLLFLVPDLNGVDQFRDLARQLHARGHSSARIGKILGGNYLRVAREIWGS